jgi:hypothetical protein
MLRGCTFLKQCSVLAVRASPVTLTTVSQLAAQAFAIPTAADASQTSIIDVSQLASIPSTSTHTSRPARSQQTDTFFGAIASILLISFSHHLVPPNVADTLSLPIIAVLRWLDDWPFGLKLNTGLSAFLCGSITRILELWRGAYRPQSARGLTS